MKNRNCQECGKTLVGRIDKKFCSDYCRNTYNNRLNKQTNNIIRNTNNRLRKNYKILSELNRSGETQVTRSKMYDKGFDFQIFTSLDSAKKGNTYFFVYDQGYLALENEAYLLIKRE